MKEKLTHPLVIAALLVTVTTVPFAVAAELRPTPHQTDTEIVVGVQGPGHEGYVIKYDSDGDEEWRHGNASSYHDVTMLDDGTVLASYAIAGRQNCGPYDPPCGRTGIRIIDPDPTPHVVWQWEKPVRGMGNSEIHDVEPLPGGDRFLVADMDRERLVVIDRTAKERTVIWNASRYYDPPAEDVARADWLHINDVDQLGDGRYLVSVRNANELLLLEDGPGGIVSAGSVNSDGDPQVLRGQHNPQWLADGAVLVADSSNNRIVELREREGRWVPVWEDRAALGVGYKWPRDADRLPNGNTLITDSRNDRVVEIDRDGDVVNVWRTANLPYEADAVNVGETVGGPTYGPTGDVQPGRGEGHLPGFGPAYVGLQHAIAVPAWLGEWHLPVFGLALAFLIAGLSIEVREAVSRLSAE